MARRSSDGTIAFFLAVTPILTTSPGYPNPAQIHLASKYGRSSGHESILRQKSGDIFTPSSEKVDTGKIQVVQIFNRYWCLIVLKGTTIVPGSKRGKCLLEQGLSTIEATVTTSEPLLAVVPLHPTLLPVPTIRSPHQFILPQTTIDQARTRSQQIQPHIPHTPQIPRFMIPP
ncbi:Hypothetical predicted protein [Paramuricea clavata]|uniref:Uncharacterized protein n=1 Tax=Paramuricea clavata TaxID=317549 RepID=A0A6S7G011_PARCT|nr:Hypothetical predicted protein [Paramuricea clavata]